jgi:hypothetical protein
MMKREEVLDTAKGLVCGDRDVQYGSPENNFAVIADFWTTYLASRATAPGQLASTDVAAMMVLFKVSRIAADPQNAESWIDAAGYSACGAEVADALGYELEIVKKG